MHTLKLVFNGAFNVRPLILIDVVARVPFRPKTHHQNLASDGHSSKVKRSVGVIHGGKRFRQREAVVHAIVNFARTGFIVTTADDVKLVFHGDHGVTLSFLERPR